MLLSAVTDYGRITDRNMVAAIALAGGYKTNALRLFTDRRSHGVTGAKVQRVFAAILSGGGTATTKTILQTLHMTASELACRLTCFASKAQSPPTKPAAASVSQSPQINSLSNHGLGRWVDMVAVIE